MKEFADKIAEAFREATTVVKAEIGLTIFAVVFILLLIK